MNKQQPYVINIGRQLGSGGSAIGRLLSEQLGIAYYDKEILNLAARESGFCPEIFERTDEKKGFFRSVWGSITPMMGSGNADFYQHQISDENLFRIQSDAIRRAASEASCIFIGRCADYVLREHPRCVNVFISAHLSDRIERVCRSLEVNADEAERLIEQGDRRRAEFYNFYSDRTWGMASTYHLCVNSSLLGVEATANYIRRFVEEKIF